MERIAITGANRGLGLALAQLYAARGDHVLAFCRQPESAEELRHLAAHSAGRVKVIALDIADDASIAAAAQEASTQVEALDVLIHNAGINRTPNTRGLQTVTRQALITMIDNNAVSPVMLTAALAPLLQRSARPRIVMISSQMGSLSFVRSGENYGYTMSKAAMNMAARVMASELGAQGVITITTHPGWVRTAMGGTDAELSSQESAAGLAALIDRLTPEDNGKFFKWNGEIHAW
jgi:NAD(P)-dependent dehydrogenase (short-subunit alcohol dehydrogenase family)